MAVDPGMFRIKAFLERYEALCATYGIFVSCENEAACCALYMPPGNAVDSVALHLRILRDEV